MCSESTRRLALQLFFALSFAACGKQGDPMPPARAIPQQAKDLVVHQRGDQVLLSFSYPASTLAGLPLAGVDSLTVFEILRPLPPAPAAPATPATPTTPATPVPAPAPAPPPTPAPAATIPASAPAAGTPATTPVGTKPPVEKVEFTDADYKKAAHPVSTLTGADLDGALVGGRFRLRLPLAPTATTDGQEHIYVVRTHAKGGEPSPWSNAVILVPRNAPPAPADLSAAATREGVALSWSAPAGVAGLAVLRRESSNPEWGEPLALLPADAASYLDRAATLGTRYVYTVISRDDAVPPTESAPVGEREVDYRDVFPPAAATGLRALGMAGEVRLVWEASADADVAGYFVERASGEGAFERLNRQPLDAIEYSDAAAPAGTPLTYRVIAVDRAGNASEPSDVATTQGPQR